MTQQSPHAAHALRLHQQPCPEGVVLVVSGRLDRHTVGAVRDLAHRLLEAGHPMLVLDLAEAEIGDASGLGLLVGVHQRARRGGQRLALGALSERTERLLRAARLDRVLQRSATVAPLTA